jgi:hypothetical protein
VKVIGFSGFWGMDADDSVLCASPSHCSKLLKKAEQYAMDKALNLFSLDMWYSRCLPNNVYAWSFGVVFTIMNADYPGIFEKGKRLLDGRAISEMPKMISHLNIDNYFSFLSCRGQLLCKTFYCEGLFFEHYGSSVIKYENGRIKYLKDIYYGSENPIGSDVVKLGLTPEEIQSSLKICGEIHGRSETELNRFWDNIAVYGTNASNIASNIENKANIVLFGGGVDGRLALAGLRIAGMRVRWFCDSDPRLWGAKLNGVEVISPQELRDKRDTVVVITSRRFHSEIKAQLAEMGIKAVNA